MENTVIALAVIAGAIGIAILIYGVARTKHKVEQVTTAGLVDTAIAALDEAQALLVSRARAIESDRAALTADTARVLKARGQIAQSPAIPAIPPVPAIPAQAS